MARKKTLKTFGWILSKNLASVQIIQNLVNLYQIMSLFFFLQSVADSKLNVFENMNNSNLFVRFGE